MAAVALLMVGRLAKFNDIFTSTVPTINNFSNHALRINCLTLFVQLKIQNNILFLYTTPVRSVPRVMAAAMTRGTLRTGIIHHSDRGSPYASDDYQRLVSELGMKPSMSAQGNCYDNAAMESFYGRFKTSTIRGRHFADERELRSTVFEYVEIFYNRYRKHSSLSYQSPVQFEENICPPWGATRKQNPLPKQAA